MVVIAYEPQRSPYWPKFRARAIELENKVREGVLDDIEVDNILSEEFAEELKWKGLELPDWHTRKR